MNSLIELRTEMDGGPVPALSKYARREVTGICFLTRSIFKETPRLDEAQLAKLSINGVLGGVEVLDACFGDAVLAPELVSLGAILGVAVGYNVSTEAAADDEDFTHLVMWKLFLVPLYVAVAGFEHHVAILTVVNCFENCLVSLVYPVLSHGLGSAPLVQRVRSVSAFADLI